MYLCNTYGFRSCLCHTTNNLEPTYSIPLRGQNLLIQHYQMDKMEQYYGLRTNLGSKIKETEPAYANTFKGTKPTYVTWLKWIKSTYATRLKIYTLIM